MMKKTILIFILVLFTGRVFASVEGVATPTVEGVTSATVEGVTHGGGDYTDILMFIAFEGIWSAPTYTNNGDDYPDTATTGTGAGSQEDVNTSGVRYGTNGFQCLGEYDHIIWSSITPNSAQGAIGLNLRINTFDDGGDILTLYTDGTHYLYIQCLTDAVRVLCDDGTVGITELFRTGTLSSATWYFIQVSYNFTTDSHTLYVDGSSVGTDTTNFASISFGEVRVGDWGGDPVVFDADNVIVSNDDTRNFYTENIYNLTSSPR